MTNLKNIIQETIEKYLNEVKIGDLKKRYPDKVEFLDKASKIIPNKYLEWLMNGFESFLIEPDKNLDQISKALQEFENNLKKGKIKDESLKDVGQWIKKDISILDIHKANGVADQIQTSTEKKKVEKQGGMKKWYEDDQYLIVEPKTMEASCFYGKGTKWCISAKESNMFKDYYNKGLDFLFVINKKSNFEDSHYKVAFVIYDGSIKETYDATDRQIYDVDEYYGDFFHTIFKIIDQLGKDEGIDVINFKIIHKYGRSSKLKGVKRYLDSLENAKYDEKNGWIVDGNIDLEGLEIRQLPTFYEVSGDFDCHGNHLEYLDGAPQKVGGVFMCFRNQLRSLHGGPQIVGKHYNCSNNKLETLQGCAQKIGYSFHCDNNQLETLQGGPLEVGVSYGCYKNNLVSLEGSVRSVGEDFLCYSNRLSTLEGGPQEVGGKYDCSANQLTTLVGSPKVTGGNFICSYNNLKSFEGLPNKIGGNLYARTNEKELEKEKLPSSLEELGGILIRESLNHSKLKKIIKEQIEKVLTRGIK